MVLYERFKGSIRRHRKLNKSALLGPVEFLWFQWGPFVKFWLYVLVLYENVCFLICLATFLLKCMFFYTFYNIFAEMYGFLIVLQLLS